MAEILIDLMAPETIPPNDDWMFSDDLTASGLIKEN
jgi:hypothetical protein